MIKYTLSNNRKKIDNINFYIISEKKNEVSAVYITFQFQIKACSEKNKKK